MSIIKGGVLIAGAGGGSTSVDNSTITLNQSSQIQAVATINANTATGAQAVVYDWVGTLSEYETQNVETLHPEWLCYITDDEVGGLSVYTKTEADNAFVGKGHEVVEFQAPTSTNNYTWYRLYADGWVEQGGITTADEYTPVVLPVAMADTNYVLLGQCEGLVVGNYNFIVMAKTATSFTADASYGGGVKRASWQVSGMAA